jgi:hypothetical protein
VTRLPVSAAGSQASRSAVSYLTLGATRQGRLPTLFRVCAGWNSRCSPRTMRSRAGVGLSPSHPPSGAAGGDLSGSYPTPTLAAPQGRARRGGIRGASASEFMAGRSRRHRSRCRVLQGSRRRGVRGGPRQARCEARTDLPAASGLQAPSGEPLEFAVVCSCAATDGVGDIVPESPGELVIDSPNTGAGNDGAP